MQDRTQCFEVERENPSQTRVVEQELAALAPGCVRLEIERVALTANTATYALTGDLLGYWGFFPCAKPWGRVPAIGWARVVASAHPEVSEGGRYFGWFPIARSVDVQVSVSSQGLHDEGEHRAEHAPTYRNFSACARDPFYAAGADNEDRHALLRGLFLTGMLIDSCLADHADYGAEQIVVLSASSKTAIAFAHEAAKRTQAKLVGVTSARNLEFVRALGCYGEVRSYAELDGLERRASVSIDMAGNGEVLNAVHARLGDALAYSMRVGASHFGAQTNTPPPTGPKPQMFFAPAQIQAVMASRGPAAYLEQARAGLDAFVKDSARWLTLEHGSGAEAVTRIWAQTLAGEVSPARGQIVTLA